MATAGAAAAVVGFDSVAGRWITSAEAKGGGAFEGAPTLDGTLHTDMETRRGESGDLGNVARVLPAAVLRPGSVEDVQRMIRFCRPRGIKVAARGQHHTLHGQSLTPGLAIDSATLDDIEIGPTSATVGAGVTWKRLLEASLPHGLRPPALPGFTGLSVGGHLSVGGCPMTNHLGGTVDNVRALQVVTGAGDVVECSEHENVELFEAALGGLGQFGVITRATVDLVPAQPMARSYWLHYTEWAPFFEDFRKLFDRAEMNDCFNVCMPPGSAHYVFQIQATVFYDPASPPDDAHLMRDLTLPPDAVVKVDQPYYDYATTVDKHIDAVRATLQWDRLVKPWYDVWLPEDAVEQHVRATLAEVTQEDVGTFGFILLFAQRRSAMRRPFYMLPPARGADRVWLFDLATSSTLPVRDPRFVARMRRRNRRLFDQARALGGVRYAIGVLDFDHDDWLHHYGDAWPEFERRKRLYDPDNIMTPGLRIF